MRRTRTFAAALLGAATLAGPAFAMPADPPLKPARPLVLQTVETSSGFDWGSAGIGAAAAIGVFAIALAGTVGLRRRRPGPPGSVATR